MKCFKLQMLLAFLIFASCSKQKSVLDDSGKVTDHKVVLTPEEIISVAYTNPGEISEAQVLDLVKDFPLSLGADVKSSVQHASLSVHKKIYFNESGEFTDYKIPVKSGNELSLPIYDVDISKGDLKMKAYVSADERFPAVLAYIPTPTKKSDFKILEHPMYAYALEIATRKIEVYNQLRDSLRQKTIDKIAQKTGKELAQNIDFSAIRELIAPNSSMATKELGTGSVLQVLPTTIINKIGPFTTMRWAQSGWFDSPYNDKMPISDACGTGQEKAPAGCVAVAAAQILGHIKPSLTIPYYTSPGSFSLNWSLFAAYPDLNFNIWPGDPGFGEMASLMKFVADGIGSTHSCISNMVQTSANSTNAINFLRQYVNINNIANMSTVQIKNSLDQLKIVYATGDRVTANNGRIGHAWLIDGYAVCRKGTVNGNNGTNDIVNKYDMYLHTNMGWGDNSASGWYLVNNDWNVSFDTGSGAATPYDINRLHYRTNLKNATHVSAK